MSTQMEEDTIVLDALDFEAPCDESDGRSAQFLMRCRGCGKGPLLCGVCVGEWKAMTDRWAAARATINCKHCLRVTRSFSEAVEVVPI